MSSWSALLLRIYQICLPSTSSGLLSILVVPTDSPPEPTERTTAAKLSPAAMTESSLPEPTERTAAEVSAATTLCSLPGRASGKIQPKDVSCVPCISLEVGPIRKPEPLYQQHKPAHDDTVIVVYPAHGRDQVWLFLHAVVCTSNRCLTFFDLCAVRVVTQKILLTIGDFARLIMGKALNDPLMNLYLKQLATKKSTVGDVGRHDAGTLLPRSVLERETFICSTHLAAQLDQIEDTSKPGAHNDVLRWTKGLSLFGFRFLFVPVFVGENHWVLLVFVNLDNTKAYWEGTVSLLIPALRGLSQKNGWKGDDCTGIATSRPSSFEGALSRLGSQV